MANSRSYVWPTARSLIESRFPLGSLCDTGRRFALPGAFGRAVLHSRTAGARRLCVGAHLVTGTLGTAGS
jgi:hypothetical protein